ncbi:hypothetical protein D9611_012772 [Ephemerocybe angulata]|uniref:F-box domain-containing protein n=1 Tax=Ephemerocybe angulata TaxID=980116 RepID=A0A8H5CCL9_9AGAR|nr:hypothetical protein D9611_012772 [Tulosesus angulatus]
MEELNLKADRYPRWRIHIQLDEPSGPKDRTADPLDHEILLAQGVLKDIEQRRNLLLDQLARLDDKRLTVQGVLSAVRRIPLEILGDIFTEVLPFVLNHEARNELLNLVLVCKRWREACLLTKRLWSSITIKACWCQGRDSASITWVHKHEEISYKKMVAWLGRSGTIPKVVRYIATELYCPCGDGDHRCHTTHPALIQLMNEGPPIAHFTLCISSTRCCRTWMNSMADAPASSPWITLKSFSLSFIENSAFPWDDFEGHRSMFALLPAVQVFRLYLPDHEDAFLSQVTAEETSLHLQSGFMRRLTEFSIRWDWGGPSLFHALRDCASLVTLTIDLNYGELRWNAILLDGMMPLELPNLRRFALRRAGADILNLLQTPLLEHLDMEFNVDGTESDGVSRKIRDFLHRSNIVNTLQTLRICDLVRTSAYTHITLPNLTSLRHLVLDCNTFGYIIKSLERNRDDEALPPFLPKLEHLELHNLERGFNLDAELAFLDAKFGGVPCLITVSRVDDPVVVESDLQNRLRIPNRGLGYYLRCIPFQEYERHKIWDY